MFGLIIFEAEHRRKEIGVRKVYGASTGQILWMFGRSYLVLSLVSSVIATPVAWYGVTRWLEQFSQRVPLSPWVFVGACAVICLITEFVGACAVICLITEVTITVQNYRAATANPVDSLKTE